MQYNTWLITLALILQLLSVFLSDWTRYNTYKVGLFKFCTKENKCVDIQDSTFLVLDSTLKRQILIVAVFMLISVILLAVSSSKLYIGISLLFSAIAVVLYYFTVYKYKYFPGFPKLGYSFYLALLGVILCAIYLYVNRKTFRYNTQPERLSKE